MKNNPDIERIFSVNSESDFEKMALEIFRFQAMHNIVYKEYIFNLGLDVKKINSIREIPFLPIEFFKKHNVISYGNIQEAEQVFLSSGTTSADLGRHYVKDISVYIKSFEKTFEIFFNSPDRYAFLALLPSYLEKGNSSLVFMVENLMKQSGSVHNGFYLNNFRELYEKLQFLEGNGIKTILFGVSYALLDFAEKYPIKLKNTVIVETGGMKGRRKELTREEMYAFLCEKFGITEIYSEYGMTELLSQAYSLRSGKFVCSPWMRVLTRDLYDPFSYVNSGNTGGINVIDLANVWSCSFIETKDVGKINEDGKFEVLGRIDYSETRGCNLLYTG